MTLAEKLITIYPELDIENLYFKHGILLQDDTNGLGPYIKEWGYDKPQPTQEQLDALND